MRKIMLTAILFFAFCFPCYAVEAEDFDVSALEEALPESAKEILGGDFGVQSPVDSIFQRIWEQVLLHIKTQAQSIMRPVTGLIALAVISACADKGKLKNEIDYVNLATCLSAAALCVGDMNAMTAQGAAAIGEMGSFSRMLLPMLSTVAAAAGALSSAGAKYAAAAMFLDILIALTQNFLLPLVGVFLAAALASAIIADNRLRSAVRFLKWVCKISLSGLAAVFTAYLGLSGIAASGTDSAAARAARTLISNVLPVVGRMVSDASESLVAGAGVIRNAIGVFGLAAVIAVCVLPFLSLGLRYVLFKAAAAVVGLISGGRLSELVDDIGSACGMILACVGSCAIFLFISILSMIRTVV